MASNQLVTKRDYVSIGILCTANLLNYMDRFTISAVLADVQEFYNINDSLGGLIRTCFMISYSLASALFGYLGDRYSRKYIMAAGILQWALFSLLGSFMHNYYWFVFCRAMLGIGQGNFCTISPTLIMDIFSGTSRTKWLSIYYFAIPVGCGLGYITGGAAAKLCGCWTWALRVTTAPTVIVMIVMLIVLKDPPRGQSDGLKQRKTSSLKSDIKNLLVNKSFMLSNSAFTCISFTAGAVSWWGPNLLSSGTFAAREEEYDGNDSTVNLIFGVITMTSGVAGLVLGFVLSKYLSKKFPRSNPFICAIGLFVSTPLLLGATYLIIKNEIICYILLFLGQTGLCMNWAIFVEVNLSVIMPDKRSFAGGFTMVWSHAFGDIGSPYFVGFLSDVFKYQMNTSYTLLNRTYISYASLRNGLLVSWGVEFLGGLFFIWTAVYYVKDQLKVVNEIAELNKDAHEVEVVINGETT